MNSPVFRRVRTCELLLICLLAGEPFGLASGFVMICNLAGLSQTNWIEKRLIFLLCGILMASIYAQPFRQEMKLLLLKKVYSNR